MPYLTEITYFLIFGKPLIFYIGIAVLACLLTTATLGYLLHNGSRRISFQMHMRMAVITIALAILHGALGILAYI